jgi:predicted small secreted protein
MTRDRSGRRTVAGTGRRVVPVVVVIACVLLAGCASVLGPGAGTGAASTADGRPSPPGVDGDGLANASALLDAHRSALAASGFAVAVRVTNRSVGRTSLGPGGNRTVARRAVAAPGVVRYRDRRRTVTPSGCRAVDRWSNGSVGVRRSVLAPRPNLTGGPSPGGRAPLAAGSDPTVAYRAASPTVPAAAATGTTRLGRPLRRGNYSLTAVRGDATRTPRYVLVATGYVPGPDEAVEADRVGFDAAVVVDARGRVLRLQATTVRVERNAWGVSRRVHTVSYRLLATGGTTVPRPEWLVAGGAGGAGGVGRPSTDVAGPPAPSPAGGVDDAPVAGPAVASCGGGA